MKVLEVDPGFRVDKIVTMDVALPWPAWNDHKARTAEGVFYRNLLDRLKHIPGVREAGAANGLPLDGGLPNGMFLLMRPDQAPKVPDTLDGMSRLFDSLFRDKQNQGKQISARRRRDFSSRSESP